MSVTTGLNDLVGETTSTTSTTGGNGHSSPVPAFRTAARPADDTLVVVPAGWLGDIVGSLAGVAGRAIGGAFGNEKLGGTIGDAAGPIIKHFSPFQVLPPAVTPAAAGPGQPASADEALIVVPAGFVTGLLGGVGGKLIGEVIGGAFGNKQLGGSIGGAVLGAVGSVFGPFSVAPPALTPASAGAEPVAAEPLFVVPAGFVGNLLGGVARSLADLTGNDTVRTVTGVATGLLERIVPWQALPTPLAPLSAGPGSEPVEDLVVVPAGWLADMLTTYGRTIYTTIPQYQGGAPEGAGQELAPFSTVPPAQTGGATEEMILVPAGLFGGLLTSLGGTLGGAIGKAFGNEQVGRAIGDAAGSLGRFVPFQVVPH